MTDQFAMFLGRGVMAAGGLFLMGLVLCLAIVVVNYFGKRLWAKLLSLHDIHVLYQHMRKLEAQGQMLRKPESGND